MEHHPKFLALVEQYRTQVNETDIHAVHQAFESNSSDFVLIDVREESEWAAGHLPNAIHLGKGIIERDVEGHFPNPETKLILYCGGGFRSVLAAEQLQRMGYTNVISMDGGFRAWKDAGFEVQVNPLDR